MAAHPRILAWRIPCTVEPGGLQSVGEQNRTRLSDYTTQHRYALPSVICWVRFSQSQENHCKLQSSLEATGVPLRARRLCWLSFRSCRFWESSTHSRGGGWALGKPNSLDSLSPGPQAGDGGGVGEEQLFFPRVLPLQEDASSRGSRFSGFLAAAVSVA